jgi:hypothetical protein
MLSGKHPCQATRTASHLFFASFLGGDCAARAVVFVGDGLANFLDFITFWVGDLVCHAYKFGGTL